MSANKTVKRRDFLRKSAQIAAAGIAAPYFVPSTVFSRPDRVIPSEKITIACIGVGWQGTGNMENLLKESDAQIVAVCDLDAEHLQNAKSIVDKYYDNEDCATYHDFREVIARKDVDVVSLGVPDHWHSIPAVMAAQAGKDIFGEKPLSHTLVEGRVMCDAVQRYDRIWQTGSWQRSQAHFRFACELVRNGRIGKVHTVEVGLPAGHTDFARTKGLEAIASPPEELDYDFWLGPAPYEPYAIARVHKNWRWHLDYGGGQIMDWVGHHVDIAHWGMGLDRTGPVEVEGKGEYPPDGLWNTATKYRVVATYADGLKMILAGGYKDVNDGQSGTKWIGDRGWVRVGRRGLETFPKTLLKDKIGPEETHLFRSPGHFRNFLDCVKSRKMTLTPCETAHRSATPGHLGQIAMLLGRKIRFNPETEEILNDPTATRMLGKAMRSPWHF